MTHRTTTRSAALARLARLAAVAALLTLPLLLAACGGTDTVPLDPADENPFAGHVVGTEATFEVVTWNLHNFAEDAGTDEIALAALAIEAMDADVVALQEIAQALAFSRLMEQLPGWSGHRAGSDRYQNLAYIWRTDAVEVTSGPFELVGYDSRIFPRNPLVMRLRWQGREFVLINNHLKCCGDGTLNADDDGDEETRRRDACIALAEWMDESAAGANVILLGDLNDHIQDATANNVFQVWLDRPDDFRFADRDLAFGPSSNWSWGPGQSHLDHILVTAPLFGALAHAESECRTLRLDRSYSEFRNQISDHVPVSLRLGF